MGERAFLATIGSATVSTGVADTVFALNGTANASSTTADRWGLEFGEAVSLINPRVEATTNSRTGDSRLFLYRENAPVSAFGVTIRPGVTGNHASNAALSVAAGEDAEWILVTTDPATGTLTLGHSSVGVHFSGQAKSFIGGYTNLTSFTTNGGTQYFAPGSTGGINATESNARIYAQNQQTFSRLQTFFTTNSRTTSTTFRFRNNGADGNQTFTVNAGVTGRFSDTTNTDTVSAGNYYSVAITFGASGETGQFSFLGVWSNSGTARLTHICGAANGGVTVGTSTRYIALSGQSTVGTSSTANRVLIPEAGTISDLFVVVTVGHTSGTATYVINKNGSDTGVTFTVAAATTGVFSDLTNTTTVVPGDFIHAKVSGISSGSHTITSIGCSFLADEVRVLDKTLGSLALTSAGTVAAPTVKNMTFFAGVQSVLATASTTRYRPFPGFGGAADADWFTTETEAQVRWAEAATLTAFSTRVHTNARTTNTTFTIRKNAADTELAVTYGSGVTGVLSDTGSVTIAANDKTTVAYTTSTGSNSLFFIGGTVAYDTKGLAHTQTTSVVGSVTAASYSVSGSIPTSRHSGFSGPLVQDTAGSNDQRLVLRQTATVSNPAFNVTTNSLPSGSLSRYWLRKNSADVSAAYVDVPGGSTGIFTAPVGLDCVSGDDVTYRTNTLYRAESGSIAVMNTTALVTAAANVWAGCDTDSWSATASTWHFQLGARISTGSNTTIGERQIAAACAGSFSNLAMNISTNTLTSSGTFSLNINGSTSAVSISVGAGVTGDLSDADSVSVSTGDLFCYTWTGGTANSLLVRNASIHFTASSDGRTGTLTKTLGGIGEVIEGTVAVVGTLNKTLGSLTSTGAGTVAVVGTLNKTLGSLTSTSAGAVAVAGSLSRTLAAATLSSTGSVLAGVTGTLAKTLGSLTSTSAGTVAVTGSLNRTLGSLTDAIAGGPRQVVRPLTDISAGSWSTQTGATTNLYAVVDETVVDDADYIKSEVVGVSVASSTVELRLASAVDPTINTGHALRLRVQRQGTIGAQYEIKLMQGASTIKTVTQSYGVGVTTPQELSIELSEAEAANITDYSDLRVRIKVTGEAA